MVDGEKPGVDSRDEGGITHSCWKVTSNKITRPNGKKGKYTARRWLLKIVFIYQ